MLDYTHEPIEEFPRPLTKSRTWSQFEKTWTGVQMILERETRMLKARRGSLKIKTFHRPYDVLKSGKLRSDVRKPENPGVVVVFDVYDDDQKRYVPMSFECDKFLDWKDNVRAIADAMEALRKIDRYGVTGGGKQDAHYQGYRAALPSAEGKITSLDVALYFLSEHSGIRISELQASSIARDTAYKRAARKLHPDTPTGDTELFVKLQDAQRFLEQL